MKSKQDKKIIRSYKRKVLICDIMLAGLFICGFVFLFGYPIALGYALSQIYSHLWWIGFISFWIHFAVMCRNDNFLNTKIEQTSALRSELKYYINNYGHILYIVDK